MFTALVLLSRSAVARSLLAAVLLVGLSVLADAGLRAQDRDESAAECAATGRACFDVRVEILASAELPLDGFYEPPSIRRLALEVEVYRQLLMDRTPLTCTPIGGERNLASRGGDAGVSYIVMPAEAYRSGLALREIPDFLSDTLNLTIVNLDEARRRGSLDPGNYLPDRNVCWYVWHYLMIKQRWVLSVDPSEQQVLSAVFSGCYPERFARTSCIDNYIEEDARHRARGDH